MKYLSLFSGIEAATVAWKPLGWEPVAFAEIEPFPCALLAHHYPDVPNLGSVTEITSEQIAALGRIDLVVGGSPCQDLSVAGKRAGFSGERSSLFYEQMRIFHAARSFCGARWLVWENVPGAFSSQHGRDFAEVVGEMAGCKPLVPEKGWGREGVAVGSNGLLEWAVLDAQWFGVAQRRRRVFAVLDTGDWQRRPPVLFEPEGLRRDHQPSRGAGQEVAKCITRGTGQRLDSEGLATTTYSIHPHCIGRSPNAGPQGKEFLDDGSAYCLDSRGQAQVIAFPANMSGTQRATTTNLSPSLCAKNPTAVAFGVGGNGDLGHCLRSGASRADKADSTTYVVQAYSFDSLSSNSMKSQNPNSGCRNVDVAKTLDTSDQNPSKNQGGMAVVSYGIPGNWIGRAEKNGGNATQPPTEVSPCLTKADRHGVASGTMVRRLTPTECERLQGFPEIKKIATITVFQHSNSNVCFSDQQSTNALAALQSHKSLSNASPAAENVFPSNANAAELNLNADQENSNAPVLVNVQIDLERQHLQLHSQGKLLLSASIVDASEWCRLPIQAVDFVQLSVALLECLEKTAPTGRAALHLNTSGSFPLLIGNWFASQSGREIEELASDAEKFTGAVKSCMKSITSEAGRNFQNCASNLQTLLCCVSTAISSFIPSEIRSASSYALSIEVSSGYTLIPYRKKPADQCPDSPRYKALGNSMAVPVMRWIGERIENAATGE